MLRAQTIVMHAEFGALDHGTVAHPTIPQDRSTARKRVHEEMVTRTYVRAREAGGRVAAAWRVRVCARDDEVGVREKAAFLTRRKLS
jgi:hypothetical protein